MAELATLARPYAQAAFNHANKANALQPWADALHKAAAITTDPTFSGLIGDPRLSNEQLARMMFDIGGTDFGDDVQNFIRTVCENDRLTLLPEMATLFDQLRNVQENRIDVEVISAYAVKKEQKELLVKVLTKRLDKQVELTTRIDKALLGGVIIRAGDEVIDGSVLGGLNQLATQLHHS